MKSSSRCFWESSEHVCASCVVFPVNIWQVEFPHKDKASVPGGISVVQVWCSQAWFCVEPGSVWLMVGLHPLRVIFQDSLFLLVSWKGVCRSVHTGQKEGACSHFEHVQLWTDSCGKKRFVLLQELQALTGLSVIGTAMGWMEKLRNWELECSCLH